MALEPLPDEPTDTERFFYAVKRCNLDRFANTQRLKDETGNLHKPARSGFQVPAATLTATRGRRLTPLRLEYQLGHFEFSNVKRPPALFHQLEH